MADPKLTHRPAMFPFLAEYTADDGSKSGGWAVPSMITEPLGALGRLLNTPAGTMPDPQDPENRYDMLVALVSMLGGNSLKGMAKGAGAAKAAARAEMEAPRAVSFSNSIDDALSNPALLRQMDDIKHAELNSQAKALYGRGIDELTGSQEAQLRGWSDPATLMSDTGKPNPFGAAVAGNPETVRAYHGGQTKDWRTGQDYTELASTNGPWSAFYSTSQDVANKFAAPYSAGHGVFPADITLSNPKVIDAGGRHAREFQFEPGAQAKFTNETMTRDGDLIKDEVGFTKAFPWTEDFRNAVLDPSTDGIVLKNTADEGDVYIPTKRGTVRSPLTGELLFSDTGKPSLLGSALTAIQNPDNRPEWMKQLDALKGWGT